MFWLFFYHKHGCRIQSVVTYTTSRLVHKCVNIYVSYEQCTYSRFWCKAYCIFNINVQVLAYFDTCYVRRFKHPCYIRWLLFFINTSWRCILGKVCRLACSTCYVICCTVSPVVYSPEYLSYKNVYTIITQTPINYKQVVIYMCNKFVSRTRNSYCTYIKSYFVGYSKSVTVCTFTWINACC